MDNVNYEVRNGKLIVTMDVSPATIKRAEPSASGKTRIVSSTRGAQVVDGTNGLKLSLNLTAPK